MKKMSKIMALSLILVLCIGFVQIPAHAESNVDIQPYMENIISGSCTLSIYSDGEASISAVADARDGKTIRGKIKLQRRTSYGWVTVKTFRGTGYGGELYMGEYYQLYRKGTYRLKFTLSCDGESYSYYTRNKYYH